jgi:hypothetical protein
LVGHIQAVTVKLQLYIPAVFIFLDFTHFLCGPGQMPTITTLHFPISCVPKFYVFMEFAPYFS